MNRGEELRLRPYQADLDSKIVSLWQSGAQNVMAVLSCGGGKTAIGANRIYNNKGYSAAIAHRQELLGQMSRTLAFYGIKHRIFAPKNVIRSIISTHINLFRRDFYDPSSPCTVVSVDTLASWMKPGSKQYEMAMRWAAKQTLWIGDEGHHWAGDSKWIRVSSFFKNALGLLLTATPCRADGKGLGRHADGIADALVEGPSMRELINGMPDWDGNIIPYLSDYRIVCPPSDLDLSSVGIGSDGDYIRKSLALKTRNSSIMGNVVEEYSKRAYGKLGITFAPDIETASAFCKMFNEAGIPAELITGKTPDKVRVEFMKRFEARKLLQIISVDVLGEGVDIPAVETISFARATQSYGLYVQQFGRGCRLMKSNPDKQALIIDHVGNVLRHGLPDAPRVWTLDRRERRTSSNKDLNEIPMRVCANPDTGEGIPCAQPYERFYVACPYCGFVPVPTARTSPEQVDGDLQELDAATLAAMRGEIAKVDRSADDVRIGMQRSGAPPVVYNGAAKQHIARQEAQAALREAITWYGGAQRAAGRTDREGWKRFYLMFGVDVLTAQALGRPETEELTARVYRSLV